MVSRRSPHNDWLLLDLETGKEQIIEGRGRGIARWVADDIWARQDGGGTSLLRVPELTKTRFPKFDNNGRVEVVKELLRQSDHIYALEEGGRITFW